MTMSNKQERQKQTRTQKIVMWTVFAVAAVLAAVAIIIVISSGTSLF